MKFIKILFFVLIISSLFSCFDEDEQYNVSIKNEKQLNDNDNDVYKPKWQYNYSNNEFGWYNDVDKNIPTTHYGYNPMTGKVQLHFGNGMIHF
jgi:hypothetical protein